MTTTPPPAEGDQYLKLPSAHIVATRALLRARKNLDDTIETRAMMCVYDGAGFGKTLSANTCLRDLEPDEEMRRIASRSRPTARAVRHEIFAALDLGRVVKFPPAPRRHARTLAAPDPDPSTSSTRV
ncbi:hypothetical protein AB0P32_22440, partial [Streptomyces sp. NPDC085995]